MKDFWIVSLMLFSMFFGAGNFIFPPMIGAELDHFWLGTLAFTLSAVALPVLGVAAIARSGNMHALASRVHPLFSLIFGIAIYSCIGPLFAIPRASVMPLNIATQDPNLSTSLIYSAIYYLLNYLICLRPSVLINALGKFITPLLIIVLVVLITGVLTVSPEQIAPAQPMSTAQAFIQGYSTMDALAALVFGTSVILALKSRGIKEASLVKSCILAGIVAGVILAAVYVGLSFCGHEFSKYANTNGAQLLGALTNAIFGSAGVWVLSSACFLACFSTTLGLIGSGAEHFSKWGGYRLWVGIYCLAGFIMSTLGLDSIIDASVQVLIWLYPPAILLILSAFLPRCDFALRLCIVAAFFTLAASAGLFGSALAAEFNKLPLAGDGLSWLLVSAAVWLAAALIKGIIHAARS